MSDKKKYVKPVLNVEKIEVNQAIASCTSQTVTNGVIYPDINGDGKINYLETFVGMELGSDAGLARWAWGNTGSALMRDGSSAKEVTYRRNVGYLNTPWGMQTYYYYSAITVNS